MQKKKRKPKNKAENMKTPWPKVVQKMHSPATLLDRTVQLFVNAKAANYIGATQCI